MATTAATSLDYEIAEQASRLTSAQKREAIQFIQFLAARRKSGRTSRAEQKGSGQSLDAIIGIASGGEGETDLSINHDHYLYGFPRK